MPRACWALLLGGCALGEGLRAPCILGVRGVQRAPLVHMSLPHTPARPAELQVLIPAAERFGVALLAATLLALGAPSLPAVAATAAPSAAEGPAAAEQAAQPSGVERRIPSTMATDAQVLQLERERSKMPEIQAPTGSDLERMMASPGMRTGKDPRAHS